MNFINISTTVKQNPPAYLTYSKVKLTLLLYSNQPWVQSPPQPLSLAKKVANLPKNPFPYLPPYPPPYPPPAPDFLINEHTSILGSFVSTNTLMFTTEISFLLNFSSNQCHQKLRKGVSLSYPVLIYKFLTEIRNPTFQPTTPPMQKLHSQFFANL